MAVDTSELGGEASRVRVRASAAAWFVLGLALTSLAVACASSTVRVHHPISVGFMYLWFGALSFFAAWASQTQVQA